MRRRFATVLFVASLFVLVCGRPTGTTNENPVVNSTPVRGDWGIIRYEAEPDTLNPILRSTAYSDFVTIGANNSQIYELMMGYNNKDWAPTEPILVEAPPEISADHLTYT